MILFYNIVTKCMYMYVSQVRRGLAAAGDRFHG